MKIEECRICGRTSDITFIDEITELCMLCQTSEEYNEMEKRICGC